ncbi:nicotinate (nicotinamide) nucleotide adenylyltransferase [Oribacterium sinus]|uniref:nicotinate (nicotinamide) nucleotide adenylyltransferase n=1 Tax=Oribacterium sinus TaxID=237576 RepID=UPI0028E2F96A|nr:nicotinate (nicotinamide) nucleotide adenylyltransferase [Oribacterium sinus]
MKPIAILGGSFNPVHYGHLKMAEAAMESTHFSKVLFIPTGTPYHKEQKDLLPFSDRLKLLELAIENCPDFDCSPIEGERDGNSYTIDTVRELLRQNPTNSYSLLIGTDQFLTLRSWHKIKELGKLVDFYIANRNGEMSFSTFQKEKEALEKELSLHCKLFPMPAIDLSSTEIRNLLKEGKSIHGMLPKSVEEYILKKGFYR